MIKFLLVSFLFVCVLAKCPHGHDHGGHGHDHGHGHEAPKYNKYSKEANVPEDQGHGHAHGGHGHAHGGDDHGHAHGGHGHAHGHEDKPASRHAREVDDIHEDTGPADHASTHEEPADHGHDHGHDHAHSHGHGHSHGNTEEEGKTFTPPTQKEPVAWWEPLAATGIISAAPFLILFLVPLDSNQPENAPFLKVLLAFASGGLLGDAFLHLIPHAISPHSHDGSEHSHSHSHGGHDEHDHLAGMIVGLWVLAGVIAFLCVEKCVRHIKGGHGHSHGPPAVKEEDKAAAKKKDDDADDADDADDDKKEESTEVVPAAPVEDVKIAAYLNLVADCTHNFTDGLAIGASFLVSRNVGLITTLTIFLHEIPHEIGDYAILIQSGCTKRKAMGLQLVTAVGAFAGCIVSMLTSGLGTAAVAWILPFTAGGFIYIATVTVIPELLEKSTLGQSVKEIFAMLVGVFIMVVIAVTE